MSIMMNAISITPRRDMHDRDGGGVDSYSRAHEEAIRELRRRVIVFDKKDMCLCGLLSLPRSVQLVCAIEVFFSMVLLLQSPDLLRMDGTYFYFLGLFDGKGWWFFVLHLTVCLSCVLTSLLLAIGVRVHVPLLVIPHVLWQATFICLCIALTTLFLGLGFYGRMLMPSSIVLAILLMIPACFEVWWCFLSLQLFHHMTVYGHIYKHEDEEPDDTPPYYSTEI